MKICIFGGSGKTGLEIVKQAIERGYSVVASDLSTNSSFPSNSKFTFVSGSVLDHRVAEKTLHGCNAVISELGVGIGDKNPIVSEGNEVIISSMKKLGIKRFVTQSAFGANESWKPLPAYLKVAHKVLLNPMSKDKDKMEDIVKNSNLDWTIVRPIRLTNGGAQHTYQFGTDIKFGYNPSVSRADVADFILNELEHNEFIHKAVTITN